MEEENHSGVRLPKLSRTNWVTEFRDAFKDYALGLGEAGQILAQGVDNGVNGDTRVPTFDMVPLIEDPNNRGRMIPDPNPQHRKYPNDQVGVRLFENDLKEYKALKASKMKIISKLLLHMEKDIRDKVEAQQGFANAYRDANLLALWQMTEQVVQGRGAISIYSVTTKFLTLKQGGPDDWPKFAKEWRGLHADLMRFGDAQAVLEAIVDTYFVMAVNQEQFKEQLTTIYGANNWPHHDVLMAQLNTYAENQQRMKDLKRETGDGKIQSYPTDVQERKKKQCFNCGSTEHLKWQCQEPPHQCKDCGRNHLEKFCLNVETGKKKVSGEKKAKEAKEGKGKLLTKNPKTNKAKNRKKVIKKAISYIADQMGEGYADEDEDEFEDDEDEDDEDDAETVHYSVAGDEEEERVLIIDSTEEEFDDCNERVMKVNTREDDNTPLILDTGCKRLHVCKQESLLRDMRSTNARIIGINSEVTAVHKKGDLPLVGETLCPEKADATVLSVMSILQRYKGHLMADAEKMIIYDQDGEIVLKATTNLVDGFWACTYNELLKREKSRAERKRYEAYPSNAIVEEEGQHPLPRNVTAEQRNRAKEAWKLCALRGHPGFDTIMRDLDNGTHPDCPLTSADVKLAIELFGPCTACIESKMRAPHEPASQTPPAQDVGEHLHADLIPLKTKSIGGNTVLLTVVDEKSNFIITLPLSSKSTNTLQEGFEQIITFYNTYGHTVKRVTIDAENTLKNLKSYLQQKKIVLTNTPAGLHEKRVERAIQTLKDRKNAILASLDYEFFPNLESEVYVAAATAINSNSNVNTKPYTPYHLVTGRKPINPQWKFGQPGLFHCKRKDMPNSRAEWGIFLGYGDAPGSLRAYIPHNNGVYSRRKFIPHDTYPSEWKLQPRIRKIITTVAGKPTIEQQPSVLLPVGSPLGVTPLQFVPPTIQDLNNLPDSDHPAAMPLPHQEGVAMTPSSIVTNDSNSDGVKELPPENVMRPQTAPPIAITVQPTPPVINSENTNKPVAESVNVKKKRTAKPPPVTTVSNSEGVADTQPTTNARGLPIRAAAKNKGWTDGRYDKSYFTNIEDLELLQEVYRISLKQALKMEEHRATIMTAIEDEIKSIMRNKVLKPVRYKALTEKQRQRAVPAHMFLKFKYKADGTFSKVKARTVANGDKQHPDTIGDTFSPTVNSISVFTQLNIAVTEDYEVASYDIKEAFLIPPVKTGAHIIIKVSGELAALWVAAFPYLMDYLTPDGELYFIAEKYIYGLPEAPRQFNNYVSKKLMKLGFKPTKADRCLYYKWTKYGRMMISIHVDDMLVTSPNKELLAEFEEQMKKYFELVAQKENISYLGMNIVYDKANRKIHLSQEGFIKNLLKKYECEDLPRPPKTPATAQLMQDPKEFKNNSPVDKKEFLGLIMSLMYPARFTCPWILLPVTVLATRSSNPMMSDYAQALRILRYLGTNPKQGLCFDGTKPIKPQIYADASHGSHFTGHGQAGIVITFGSSPIYCRSYKLKSITRSSSESELYALEEASTYAVWLRLLLEELKVLKQSVPIPIYQDNLSTIILANEGEINFKRTKHLLARESYVKERIDRGEIVLKYKPTAEMSADFLTKPLSRVKIQACLQSLNIK